MAPSESFRSFARHGVVFHPDAAERSFGRDHVARYALGASLSGDELEPHFGRGTPQRQLVLCDLMLPTTDGREWVAELLVLNRAGLSLYGRRLADAETDATRTSTRLAQCARALDGLVGGHEWLRDLYDLSYRKHFAWANEAGADWTFDVMLARALRLHPMNVPSWQRHLAALVRDGRAVAVLASRGANADEHELTELARATGWRVGSATLGAEGNDGYLREYSDSQDFGWQDNG